MSGLSNEALLDFLRLVSSMDNDNAMSASGVASVCAPRIRDLVEAEAKLEKAREILEHFAAEFDRLEANYEGFESLFKDDVSYVGGKINIGHLRAARATLKEIGEDNG